MVTFQCECKEDVLHLQETQFVSVHILDGSNPLEVFDYITGKHPNVKRYFYDADIDEIVIEMPKLNDSRGKTGCTLQKLREAANEISKVEVACFDVSPEFERYVWLKSLRDTTLTDGYRLTDMWIGAGDCECTINGCLQAANGKKYPLPFDVSYRYTDEGYKFEIAEQRDEFPEDVWDKIESKVTKAIERFKEGIRMQEMTV